MNKAVLDTNVFIRHLVGDVPEQTEKAREIFNDIEGGKISGFVSILVINEFIWILEKYYGFTRNLYIPKLLKLLVIRNLKIIETKKELIIAILETMQKRKFDFTDVYLALTTKKEQLVSFDKDFGKLYR